MNIHHLELFYYVARHGGIAEAVRRMPYSIQQPAISAQIIQLEEFLGTGLFQRRPFKLTQAGSDLYDFIVPFFANKDEMADRLRGLLNERLRIGASVTVLRDYLPPVLVSLRGKFPNLRVVLREAQLRDLLQALDNDELDVTITSMDGRHPAGFRSVKLTEVQLELLVPKNSKLSSAEQIFSAPRIDWPLISLPAHEPLCRTFQKGLTHRRVTWEPSIEVPSLDIVATYVRHGFGIGLSATAPGAKKHPDLIALPLNGFSMLPIMATWKTRLSEASKALVDALVREGAAFKG